MLRNPHMMLSFQWLCLSDSFSFLVKVGAMINSSSPEQVVFPFPNRALHIRASGWFAHCCIPVTWHRLSALFIHSFFHSLNSKHWDLPLWPPLVLPSPGNLLRMCEGGGGGSSTASEVAKSCQGQHSQEPRVPAPSLQPQGCARLWVPEAEAGGPSPGDRNPRPILSASGQAARGVIFSPA